MSKGGIRAKKSPPPVIDSGVLLVSPPVAAIRSASILQYLDINTPSRGGAVRRFFRVCATSVVLLGGAIGNAGLRIVRRRRDMARVKRTWAPSTPSLSVSRRLVSTHQTNLSAASISLQRSPAPRTEHLSSRFVPRSSIHPPGAARRLSLSSARMCRTRSTPLPQLRTTCRWALPTYRSASTMYAGGWYELCFYRMDARGFSQTQKSYCSSSGRLGRLAEDGRGYGADPQERKHTDRHSGGRSLVEDIQTAAVAPMTRDAMSISYLLCGSGWTSILPDLRMEGQGWRCAAPGCTPIDWKVHLPDFGRPRRHAWLRAGVAPLL